MLLNVKVAKTKPWAKLPERMTPESAGADLYACIDSLKNPIIEIAPGETKMISAGIKTVFDSGHVALIYARSGLSIKHGLAPANKVGVIDSDYRGEWYICLYNHSNQTQCIQNGDRIAQVVFQEVDLPSFDETDESEHTSALRGEGGIGSSGK